MCPGGTVSDMDIKDLRHKRGGRTKLLTFNAYDKVNRDKSRKVYMLVPYSSVVYITVPNQSEDDTGVEFPVMRLTDGKDYVLTTPLDEVVEWLDS